MKITNINTLSKTAINKVFKPTNRGNFAAEKIKTAKFQKAPMYDSLNLREPKNLQTKQEKAAAALVTSFCMTDGCLDLLAC